MVVKALELSNEEQKKLLHVSKKFISYMHHEQVLCLGIMVDLDHMYVYLCYVTRRTMGKTIKRVLQKWKSYTTSLIFRLASLSSLFTLHFGSNWCFNFLLLWIWNQSLLMICCISLGVCRVFLRIMKAAVTINLQSLLKLIQVKQYRLCWSRSWQRYTRGRSRDRQTKVALLIL